MSREAGGSFLRVGRTDRGAGTERTKIEPDAVEFRGCDGPVARADPVASSYGDRDLAQSNTRSHRKKTQRQWISRAPY
jgi:hypothetical protein